MPDNKNNGQVTLKHWQFALILIVQLAGFAYTYGQMSQKVDDTRQEFYTFQQEVNNDLRQINGSIQKFVEWNGVTNESR